MPKTATPRKPETVSSKLAETRAKSKNRSLSSLLGIGDNEKRLATDLGSGLNDVIGRGTIAGLLGLPGDLGGAAENGLRSLLGLPQVTPYGGSEHIGQKMEEAGLVSSVRRPKTELLASLISPAQAATAGYKAPQMARAGVKALDNLSAPRTMGRMGQRGAVETDLKGLQGLVGGGDNAPMGNPIEVWHGTDVEFGRPNTPLFLGDRPMAEAYARRRADESGFNPILMGGTANFKKIASEDDVKRIAKSVGVVVENDMAFHALDPNINGRHNSQKLIDALRAEGYDSAHIDDFSPDDPFTLTKSYVALDPDQLSLKPVGNLGKMVAPQDEALRVAQANAAKPVEEGGLGLRPDNTPEERAAAMGYFDPQADEFYRGQHTAPMSYDGAPAHDLTGGGNVYPDDVYSSNAVRYYGHGEPTDASLFSKLHSLRGKPDESVRVFRAVPTDVFNAQGHRFNHGDWITPNRAYAVEHGEGALNGDYKIIAGNVPARTMFTNGDSPYEFGLDKTQYFADGPASLPVMHSKQFQTLDRSRFAAFDPMRRDSSDLLAGIAPFGAIPWLRDEQP